MPIRGGDRAGAIASLRSPSGKRMPRALESYKTDYLVRQANAAERIRAAGGDPNSALGQALARGHAESEGHRGRAPKQWGPADSAVLASRKGNKGARIFGLGQTQVTATTAAALRRELRLAQQRGATRVGVQVNVPGFRRRGGSPWLSDELRISLALDQLRALKTLQQFADWIAARVYPQGTFGAADVKEGVGLFYDVPVRRPGAPRRTTRRRAA